MTIKELTVSLIGCNADSEVVLEDDVEFTDEYGKLNGTCYQIEKVVKHGRSVSLHFDNRQHFMRKAEPTLFIRSKDIDTDELEKLFAENPTIINIKPMYAEVLDKIRAEIDDATEIHSDGEFYIKNFDVKRIIGKYKDESEDKK